MKHGKKPTVAQRKLMEKRRLKGEDWLVVKDTPNEMILVHRHFDRVIRKVPKGGGSDGKAGSDAVF